MRKTLLIPLIGFAIMIIFAIFIQSYLEKTSEELVDNLSKVISYVDEDKIEEAIEEREKMQMKWDKTRGMWAVLIDHEELDNIEEIMHVVEILLEDPEQEIEVLSELNKLNFYLEHIPKREEFSLENIL